MTDLHLLNMTKQKMNGRKALDAQENFCIIGFFE